MAVSFGLWYYHFCNRKIPEAMLRQSEKKRVQIEDLPELLVDFMPRDAL